MARRTHEQVVADNNRIASLRYDRATARYLWDVYGTCSRAKERAYEQCGNKMHDMNGYGVDYHNVDQKAVSAALVSKVDAIKRIMNAFNHDDSNGMVDYFDTHFYENIRLIAA